MFETLGFENMTPLQASVLLALVIGLAFGALAERTAFCFRRALVGEDRRAAAGVWLNALAVALLGTQAAVAAGWIGFEDHRLMATEMPLLAILVGGLLFGAGMVLARGCASRLTVLAGTGNLRAALVILIFAITAHATLKGVLAPLRTSLGSFTIQLDSAALPGPALVWTLVLAAIALVVSLRSGNRLRNLGLAALIGALVPAGWVGTGFLLFDEFDPIAVQSLSFTAPASESLFWVIAATAIPAGFGTGLVGGVIAGSLVAALLFGSFRWQSFESPAQTGRYLLGGAMMGVGGVLAGGCTVGAGLSGIPTLSIAAVLAIAAMAIGALATNRAVNAYARESGAPSTTPAALPAE